VATSRHPARWMYSAQPISSIASLSELLAADWTELDEDIRLELATKIDKNTHRLIKMMNDLQLLFRLDTGSVTARRTPVPILHPNLPSWLLDLCHALSWIT